MAFEVDYDKTRQQLKHVGEFATGKADGSPTGADIDTTTLTYTGQVRKTLPKIIEDIESLTTDKQQDFQDKLDSADEFLNSGNDTFIPDGGTLPKETVTGLINETRSRISQAISENGLTPFDNGVYAAGKTYTAYNQYLIYSVDGSKWLVKSTVDLTSGYTTTESDPNNDTNLRLFNEIDERAVVARANDVTLDKVAILQTGVSYAQQTHLYDAVNGITLIAWDTLTFPYVVTSVTANAYAGYDVVTDQGTFEFVTSDVKNLRNMGNLKGWGVSEDGTDQAAKVSKALSESTNLFLDGLEVSITSVGAVQSYTTLRTINGASFKLIESNTPYYFDISGTVGVNIDITVDGDRDNFTYAENTSTDRSVNSRFRYCPIFGVTVNDAKLRIDAKNLYSLAIGCVGGFDSDYKATSRNIKISGKVIDSNFEISVLQLCGAIEFDDCYTYNITNDFTAASLVGNGAVTTACDDVIVTANNYFGVCEGSNFKAESLNGKHYFGAFTAEDAAFQGINLQESSIERPGIDAHVEEVILDSPVIRRAKNYAVSGESSTTSASCNVHGTIIDESCARGTVHCAGYNWNVHTITRGEAVADGGGVIRNRPAVLIKNESGLELSKLVFNVNWDGATADATLNSAVVSFGNEANSSTIINGVKISGLIKNHVFRGVFGQNNISANNVNLDDLEFVRDTPDGVNTYDIYFVSNVDNLSWSLGNISTPQGILVRLSGNGSTVTTSDIKPTWPNANQGNDNTNQYWVRIDANRGPFIDNAGRWNGYGSSLVTPTLTGNHEIGDRVLCSDAGAAFDYWWWNGSSWIASNA